MDDHTSPAPLDRRPGHRNKNVQRAAVLLLAGAIVAIFGHGLTAIITDGKIPMGLGRAADLIDPSWSKGGEVFGELVNPDFLVALVEVLLAITVGVALAVRMIGWLVIVAQALGWIFAVQALVYLVSTLAWLIMTHSRDLFSLGGFIVVMQAVLLGCAATIPWILGRYRQRSAAGQSSGTGSNVRVPLDPEEPPFHRR